MGVSVRIEEYSRPRNSWRRTIHRDVLKEQRKTRVKYEPSDKLEVVLRLYFTDPRAVDIHDVDNRLKDCLDALQGRVGGTKTKATRALRPIVPNDCQIWTMSCRSGRDRRSDGASPLSQVIRT